MKQLRNRADEDARMIHMSIQMGNDPPISLRRDLEHLMLLVSLIFLKITVTNNDCGFHLSSENPSLYDTIRCLIFPFWDEFFFSLSADTFL